MNSALRWLFKLISIGLFAWSFCVNPKAMLICGAAILATCVELYFKDRS